MTGSGWQNLTGNTGLTQGPGTMNVGGGNTGYTNNSSVNRSTTGGTRVGGRRASSRSRGAPTAAGVSGTGDTSQQYSGYGGPGSNTFANVNMRSHRRRGGLASYHRGGIVSGDWGTEGLALLEGGERVLPRTTNRQLEALTSEVAAYRTTAPATTAEATEIYGDKLDAILDALERQHREPRPVKVDNVEAITKAFVAGALVAQASDAAAELNGNRLTEALEHFMAMNGIEA